jgi:two-component system sensor histidine kinase DesK
MRERRIGSGRMDGQAATPWGEDTTLEAPGDAVDRVLPRGIWRLFSAVWLFFFLFPIYGLQHAHPATGRLIIVLTGMTLLIGAYLWLMLHRPFPDTARVPSAHWLRVALLALLTACVVVLTHLEGDNWYWFFTYAGLAAGVAFPARRAIGMIAGLMVVTAIVGVMTVGWLQTGRIVFLVTAGGFGMIGVGHLIRTIRALRAARAEIARLAVAEERLRFARDLHDLLGHSLSTIAIKTALAHRLLPDTPERAMHELDDVQTVTQDALREVRDAVMGYRQPTLATELANAREILAAAGIACEVDDDVSSGQWAEGKRIHCRLPTAIESVLAWTVREGVTNIVRHSRARHATIRIRHAHDAIRAEISDDGEGKSAATPTSPGGGGSGLRGLAERAAAVGGQIEARPREIGGFRLAATLPLNED